LEKYGTLFNHDSQHPINPLPAQKKEVVEQSKSNVHMKNWRSIYPAGTVLRMKGNTIHAGPPSDKKHCRGIFFMQLLPKRQIVFMTQKRSGTKLLWLVPSF
jgi:hypothetical protein